MNDFFSGDTITLVEEGTWGGRFKHRNEYKMLRQVEKDFAKMYYEITKADEHRESIRKERMARDEEMYGNSKKTHTEEVKESLN